MNTLDIALESTMSLSNFVPEADVLNLPFLFKDSEEVFKVLDGEAGQKLAAKAEEYGFKILGWWYNGFRDMSNSKKSIETPDDMSGLKFRIPESEVFKIPLKHLEPFLHQCLFLKYLQQYNWEQLMVKRIQHRII